MTKIITLEDEEDSCIIQVELNADCSGALIFCTDTFGREVQLIVDARLLKQLCNKVSKNIKKRAQKNNFCGYVDEDILDD